MGFVDGFDIDTAVSIIVAVSTLILAYISYRVLRQSTRINRELLDIEKYRNRPRLVPTGPLVIDKRQAYCLIENRGGKTAENCYMVFYDTKTREIQRAVCSFSMIPGTSSDITTPIESSFDFESKEVVIELICRSDELEPEEEIQDTYHFRRVSKKIDGSDVKYTYKLSKGTL